MTYIVEKSYRTRTPWKVVAVRRHGWDDVSFHKTRELAEKRAAEMNAQN